MKMIFAVCGLGLGLVGRFNLEAKCTNQMQTAYMCINLHFTLLYDRIPL